MARTKKNNSKKSSTKASRGRVTKYKPEYDDLVYKVLRETGCGIKELAAIVGIHKATIHVWREANPSFARAIKKGRDEYNVKRCEKSLVQRAVGYEWEEVTEEFILINDERFCEVTKTVNGKNEKKLRKGIKTKIVHKKMAPDVGALCFLLKNRSPDRWREIKAIELTGKGGGAIKTITSKMTEEDAMALYQESLSATDNK